VITKVFLSLRISNPQILTQCGKAIEMRVRIAFAFFSTFWLKKSFGKFITDL
jgi:hypothetical protein